MTCSVTLNTKKLEISKIQWMCITKNNYDEILAKTTFNETEEFHHINILKKGITKENRLPDQDFLF